MTCKKGIVLNRMYVGDYLSSNLGHEVINLYQTDSNEHYIYLNASGDFASEHQNNIAYVLLVKYYTAGEVEIIGVATELEDVYQSNKNFTNKYCGINQAIYEQQKAYIDNNKISYGGVSILNIFNDAEQQSIYVTYKAKNVYVPISPMFIRFANAKESKHLDTDIVIKLTQIKQAKASLKQYIYPNKQSDYNILESLINNTSLWRKLGKESKVQINNNISQRAISLFDICQIQNDENRFSNALSYFMKRPEYYILWKEFFSQYNIVLKENFSITREEMAKIEDDTLMENNQLNGGRIDLLIRDEEKIIVIENKIKSDINSIEGDGDGKQLERYLNYVRWRIAYNNQDYGKKAYFFILTPNYNPPKFKTKQMGDLYRTIFYGELYQFLSERKNIFENDINFVAFYNAIYRHTHKNVNDYLYYDMQDKFYRRIEENNSSK